MLCIHTEILTMKNTAREMKMKTIPMMMITLTSSMILTTMRMKKPCYKDLRPLETQEEINIRLSREFPSNGIRRFA